MEDRGSRTEDRGLRIQDEIGWRLKNQSRKDASWIERIGPLLLHASVALCRCRLDR
jgi:hypothetical protein